jgi:hypothetical protein
MIALLVQSVKLHPLSRDRRKISHAALKSVSVIRSIRAHVLLQERLASGNGDSVAFADFCECQKFVNDVVCCDQWLTILSNPSRGSGVVWITAHEVRKPSARVHKNSH